MHSRSRCRLLFSSVLLVGLLATRVYGDDYTELAVDSTPVGYHTVECRAAKDAPTPDPITIILEMWVDNEKIGQDYSSGQNPRVTLSRQVEWASYERLVSCVVLGGQGSASGQIPAMDPE